MVKKIQLFPMQSPVQDKFSSAAGLILSGKIFILPANITGGKHQNLKNIPMPAAVHPDSDCCSSLFIGQRQGNEIGSPLGGGKGMDMGIEGQDIFVNQSIPPLFKTNAPLH